MQVISACVKLSAVKTEPKNVTYMVGTFLNENGDKLLKISALTIQLKPEKVTNTVGTFLNKDTINAIKLVSEKTKKIIEEIPGINK